MAPMIYSKCYELQANCRAELRLDRGLCTGTISRALLESLCLELDACPLCSPEMLTVAHMPGGISRRQSCQNARLGSPLQDCTRTSKVPKEMVHTPFLVRQTPFIRGNSEVEVWDTQHLLLGQGHDFGYIMLYYATLYCTAFYCMGL